eukprot:jgi/Botrbrau1/23166/Bobra.0041s0017.1
MVGTPYYMSPEALKGKRYDTKTDVWAAGCVLYELCCLKRAFDGNHLGAITVKIMGGKYAPIPDSYSDDMKSLLAAILNKDPDVRLSFTEVLALPYVQKHVERYKTYVKTTHIRRRSSFERFFSDGDCSLTQELGQTSEESCASTVSAGACQVGNNGRLACQGDQSQTLTDGSSSEDASANSLHMEAIREQAERLAALETMRKRDWEVSLSKLEHFKMAILERDSLRVTAPAANKPSPLISPKENRKSTLVSLGTSVSQKSVRSLSFGVPHTPTAAHTAATSYAGSMREVQDEILQADENNHEAVLNASGGVSSLPPSPLPAHQRHIATAA